jgi:hypothetical protein
MPLRNMHRRRTRTPRILVGLKTIYGVANHQVVAQTEQHRRDGMVRVHQTVRKRRETIASPRTGFMDRPQQSRVAPIVRRRNRLHRTNQAERYYNQCQFYTRLHKRSRST